ncbi:MAG: hypothetical protein JO057_27855, partial [Chloroflexi bacterium]|nr:hypothetical protein [Chloroflexota bacterium]
MGHSRIRGVARIALAALLAAVAFVASTPASPPRVSRGPFGPWTPHDVLRGMDLPPKTPVTATDYQALNVVGPGSVVLFSA